MSKVKVLEITARDSGDSNIKLSSDGSTSVLSLNQGQLAGFRSVAINGNMAVNQRGVQTPPSSGYQYPVDRFRSYTSSGLSVNGLFLVSQQTTNAESGFVNTAKIQTTTPDPNLSDAEALYVPLETAIEGFDARRFCFGTSYAKPLTVSFMIRGSISGTYSLACFSTLSGISEPDRRSYVTSFDLESTDTWEYKTITIPGCPDGIWNKSDGCGLYISVGASGGSNLVTSVPDTWQPGLKESLNTGVVSLIGTENAYLEFTGFQIELGTQATPYENILVQTQLANCQRYYESGSSKLFVGVPGGSSCALATNFKVTKRVAPAEINYSTAGARQYLPDVTEWIDNEGFSSLNQSGTECAFVWSADAEL